MTPFDAWMPHVRATEPHVLRWLGRRGLDEGTRQDVWQETLVSVMRAGTPPRADRAPQGYLWAAARREGARARRRAAGSGSGAAGVGAVGLELAAGGGAGRRSAAGRGSRGGETLLEGLAHGEPSPCEASIASEEGAAVRAAVASLPVPMRRVIEGRFFEGLSPLEVAQRLAIPVNTVATRTHRALQRLARRLAAADRRGLALGLFFLASLAALRGVLALRHAGSPPHDRVAALEPRADPAAPAFPYPDGWHWVPQPVPES